ncbi:hypothetical protein D0809_29215, partial [Flavobacterium circumlabens]
LDLRIEYNTDIYDGYLIKRMFGHFENLMLKTLAQPEIQIQEVDYLTQEEKNHLLFDLNNTVIEYPSGKTVLDLFEEQVAKTPNNIAIVFKDTQLTYKELDDQSSQLA